LKILFLGFLLFALGLCVLYRILPHLAESALRPMLEARSAQVEIASIATDFSGVSLALTFYEEPGVRIDGLRADVPWRGFLTYPDLGSLSVVCGHVGVDLDVLAPRGERDAPPSSEAALSGRAGAVLNDVSELLGALPVRALQVDLKAVELRKAGRVVAFQSDLSLVSTDSGVIEIAASVEGERFRFNGRLRDVLPDGEIALDFVAGVSDWAGCVEAYAPEFGALLRSKQVDLYLDPLGASESCIDFSGYVRWSDHEPERVRAAVLGNLGPMEVFHGDLDVVFEPASFGFATDGVEVLRAYATIPVAAVRAGAWQQSGGEVSLKINESGLHGALTLGADALSVQFSHNPWSQALENAGEVYGQLKTSTLNQELIRALIPEAWPPGLTFEAALETELAFVYRNGALLEGGGSARWDVSRAGWPQHGLRVENFSGAAEADLVAFSGTSDLTVERLEVAGMAIRDVATQLELLTADSLRVAGFDAGLLDGRLKSGPFVYKLHQGVSGEIQLHLEQINLAELSKTVPQFDGEISGVVSGSLLLEGQGQGLLVKDGLLELDESVPARLSYSTRGLLTAGLAEGSSVYEQYRMAEVALEDLALHRFRIELFPAGELTRPIRLHFYGESNQEGTIVPVDYTLNVNTNDAAGLVQLLRMMQRGELEVQ
jgi:hypothetical protein